MSRIRMNFVFFNFGGTQQNRSTPPYRVDVGAVQVALHVGDQDALYGEQAPGHLASETLRKTRRGKSYTGKKSHGNVPGKTVTVERRKRRRETLHGESAVSYTHLTLPTICSV